MPQLKFLKSYKLQVTSYNISDKELIEVYINARAFLFASVDEEFGIVLVEAMGYGLPVIAYKSGGVPETVKDGVNGYLFEKLTPDSLIQKINKFESLTEKERTAMKKQVRKTSEKFSELKFVQHIKEFIHTVSRQ
ncbi:glycosyltransferase [Candidatus Roizmanbacteria bacterium]|nr:glycosyltransferase [Candidatus Roizmanbacteria bacterium]